ncbi:MAG: hypothetical protein ABID54_05565, partial [Pseudomonadota bacterium]
MARKKSLKKAKKRIEASQKTRDRKRILDLIATLVGGEKQGHLNPEEVNGIVSELKSDPQAIPFLKTIVSGKEYGMATKLTALDILKEAGVAIDSELYHSLKATHGLIEESSQYLKEGSEDIGKSELPDRISAQILQLNEHLQRLFLHQLIQEAGEKSLLLLTRLVGKSERFDLIIADSLADLPLPGSADLLSQMAEATRDKALEKTIKRSLYRLRGKGVVVRDTTPEDPRASILRTPAKASEGHLSSIDYLGDRLVLVTQPAVTRGLYLFQALINDTKGIRDFQGMEITRKAHREYLTRLKEQTPMEIVEADPSYCQFLIEEGQSMATKKG